jgi:hypothetical protein
LRKVAQPGLDEPNAVLGAEVIRHAIHAHCLDPAPDQTVDLTTTQPFSNTPLPLSAEALGGARKDEQPTLRKAAAAEGPPWSPSCSAYCSYGGA